MPDHSSDADPAQSPAQPRTNAPAPHADWRLGGRTVRPWRARLLALALVSLGLGILAGALVQWLWPSPWAAASGTALLWAGMLVPVVWALRRSRPAGLLRFRALDLLYGVALGLLLRLVQGWIAQVGTGVAPFPSYATVDGRLAQTWWLTDVVAVVAIAPLVEEFFFRAVILVAVFTILRRPFGHVAAGISAVVVSAAAFVMLHSLLAPTTTDAVIATALLGAVCASLVMLTGRIWVAVLVHAVFNATYVLLAIVGTFLV